jgi:tetratricopeptide (TPR) repeat protein
MRRLCLAWLVVSVGCASVPIRKADLGALAQADRLVLEGCYDCLLDAQAIYARVAVGRARPLVVTRLFETDLLITLREKELALASSGAWTRARALAKELPSTIDAARYLAIVEAVPPDDVGWSRRQATEFRRAHGGFGAKVAGEVAWLRTPGLSEPVRQYLTLAIGCLYPDIRRPGVPERLGAIDTSAPAGAPPLVAYRAGICRNLALKMKEIEQVHSDVPRFAETSYFLGRLAEAVAKQAGPGHARELLGEAYGRFPKSSSVTYIFGHFNQLIGDCRAALRYYDETVALVPDHENALLGRVVCLTYLKRTDDAIEAATHMIEVRTDNIAQAYYWRAWNRRFQKAFDPAREDIEHAKALQSTPEIHTLAGMIEYDQDALDPAQFDLQVARSMSGGDRACDAMWYLGLVHMKRERWGTSAGQFEDAMGCYQKNVDQDEAGLKEMERRTDLEDDFRNAQIAGFQAALKEDRGQQYAAAFNAANHYARAGDREKAKGLVEIAANDPGLAGVVRELRRILGGGVRPAAVF